MNRTFTSLAVVGALLTSTLVTTRAGHADPRCRPVRGWITSALVTGSQCASPLGLCSSGHLSGDIHESFFFTLTTLTPNVDTPETGVQHYTGDMAVHTGHGDLLLKEIGAFNTTPNDNGDVAAVSTIVQTSGCFAGITGRLRIEGSFTPADGGHSRYEGVVCGP